MPQRKSGASHLSVFRARIGISLFFFTNGAIFAGVLPRFAEIKNTLALSNSLFGIAIIAGSIGAMCASGLPAYFIRKLGARAASLWWTFVLLIAVGALGFAVNIASVPLFIFLLFLAGLADGIVDMAQNTHAMRVQDAQGRSIINSLHALWSAGCVIGGLSGTWMAAHHVPLQVHLPISSGVLLGIAALAVKLSELPPFSAEKLNSRKSEGEERGNRGFLSLVPLALIGIAGVQIEIVGNDWSANYMDGPVAWLTSDAGIAYVVVVSSQFIGRILGDSMVDRFGRIPVARAGFLMSAVGFTLAALFPVAYVVLPAFALAGFGSATIVPAVYAAADAAPGFREGSALTFVGWIMRMGNLLTSPLIGWVADKSSLRWGILVPLVLGAAVQFFLSLLNYERPEAEAVREALAAEEEGQKPQ